MVENILQLHKTKRRPRWKFSAARTQITCRLMHAAEPHWS